MNTVNKPQLWLRRFWALPLMILIGVAIAVVIIKSQPAMEHRPEVRLGAPVTTLALEQHSVRPRALGYGVVTPDVLLEMRAEVAGRVVYRDPQLKKGSLLPAGRLVLQIDANDYQLALKKSRATLVQGRANLAEQTLAQQDAELDLQLAQQQLRLAETASARFEKLLSKGSIAQSAADTQRSSLLQARQEVAGLQNRLDAMPYNIEVLQAQIAIAESERETQQRNLARTDIRLPFDARISSLTTETDQFVSQGTPLFTAQTVDKVLINAQFSLSQMLLLARGFDLDPQSLQQLFVGDANADSLIQRLGLTARVRLAGNGQNGSWDAKVERISNNLDPVSRTIGVIVGISDPYQQIQPGIKPPLLEGMYMEIELRGRAQTYWVVPRNVLHEGELFLVDDQQTLNRLPVSGYLQQQMLLLDPATDLSADLSAGLNVVTSDLFPAVEGMLLTPSPDLGAQAEITTWLEAY
ncbi:MAG: multidrug efflux system membrane fusion protein [Motiliproteus sp.]